MDSLMRSVQAAHDALDQLLKELAAIEQYDPRLNDAFFHHVVGDLQAELPRQVGQLLNLVRADERTKRTADFLSTL